MSKPAMESSVEGFGDEIIYGLVFLGVICLGAFYLVSSFFPARGRRDNNNAQNRNRGRTRSADVHPVCAICLEEQTRLAVETNCSHVYCGRCFFMFWDNMGPVLSPPSCPTCRQRLTMVLPYFTEAEQNAAELEEAGQRDHIYERTSQFNRRFSGEPRSFLEMLYDAPMLLRHMWHQLWNNGQDNPIDMFFRVRLVFMILLCFFYGILPLDLIPEGAFGLIGFIDDILFFALVAILLASSFRHLVAQQL